MPHGIALDSADNIWVTDVALHQVRENNMQTVTDFKILKKIIIQFIEPGILIELSI